MSSKINSVAIQAYSDKLYEFIMSTNMAHKEQVTGKEIQNLTAIPQINAFILQSIFDSWIKESDSFKSDFFDFEHEEVQQAFSALKNKLSFHILVNREMIAPLINDAVHQTLNMVFNPKESFCEYFKTKKDLKFLKMHLVLKDRLSNVDTDFETVLAHYEEFEIPSELAQPLFDICPAVIEDFLIEEIEEEPLVEVVEQPIENENEEAKKTINDLFSQEENATTLADQYRTQKTITSLHKGININQRFSFIRELFDGDADEYNALIDELDEADDFELAHEIIKDKAYFKYDWNSKEAVVEDFFGVLSKKYH